MSSLLLVNDNVGFTHVDPFEDTERYFSNSIREEGKEFHPRRSVRGSERLTKWYYCGTINSFTHVDPFEDTERCHKNTGKFDILSKFHPRRSVRGY